MAGMFFIVSEEMQSTKELTLRKYNLTQSLDVINMPFGQQSHVALCSLNNLNRSALQFRDSAHWASA